MESCTLSFTGSGGVRLFYNPGNFGGMTAALKVKNELRGEVDAILAKALEKSTAKRYSTMLELAGALAGVGASGGGLCGRQQQ